MKTERIACDALGVEYKLTVLDSGLAVICFERPERIGVYASLCAGFGSLVRRYVVGDVVKVAPAGVAHFLEHKLFAGKRGDAFALFAATGASANAETSFDKTRYLFEANRGARASLKTLVEFVCEPYFTAKNVAKEKGIIEQEIKLYEDSDEWQLLFGALRLMYSEHPLRDDIAGTAESIALITPETLYECYRAFYVPENMVLAVSGNMTNDEVLDIVGGVEWLAAKAGKVIPTSESDSIVGEYAEREMSVSAKACCIGFKDAPFTGERVESELCLDVALDALFGDTTDFYREAYDEGLINRSFSYEMFAGEDYLCFLFSSECERPQKLKDRIVSVLERARRYGIDPERFEEARKCRLGDEIIALESNEDIAQGLISCYFKRRNLFEPYEYLKKMSKNDADGLLQKTLSPARSVLFVINTNERN